MSHGVAVEKSESFLRDCDAAAAARGEAALRAELFPPVRPEVESQTFFFIIILSFHCRAFGVTYRSVSVGRNAIRVYTRAHLHAHAHTSRRCI